MVRKFIDCRDFPSDTRCTVAIFADTEQELIEAAVRHYRFQAQRAKINAEAQWWRAAPSDPRHH